MVLKAGSESKMEHSAGHGRDFQELYAAHTHAPEVTHEYKHHKN
jgi:hypothetical protein